MHIKNTTSPKVSILFFFYRLLTTLMHPLAILHLKKRVRRGKEHALRWKEKLGLNLADRPEGTVVWCHAVGLGEVLALRGLLAALHSKRPNWSFLITSGTRASAQVLDDNMPPRTQHQFLPIDTPLAVNRFLNHWRPDISIWNEQDIWPNLIISADYDQIPLALVGARMHKESYEKRLKFKTAYAHLLNTFSLIAAQDHETATNLGTFGINANVSGSFKRIAPPLSVDTVLLKSWQSIVEDRFIWVLASSHEADEIVALSSFQNIASSGKENPLLVVVPRLPERAHRVKEIAQRYDLSSQIINPSKYDPNHGQDLSKTNIVISQGFGDLGLWYSLADVAQIGGSFDDVEGHNPWEAIQIGCPVIHGPRTANFLSDYRDLQTMGFAHQIDGSETLVKLMNTHDFISQAADIETQSSLVTKELDILTSDLIDLIERKD